MQKRFRSFAHLLFAMNAFTTPLCFGSQIPDEFRANDVVTATERTISLKNVKKATVFVFVSAKCPCSASHEDVLRKMSAEFGGNEFQFVGVHSNKDEDAQMTLEHFTQSKFAFPVLQDENTRLADIFGALKTPHAFVVNADGEVLFQGGVDDSNDATRAKIPYLRNALLAIQAGKTPEPKSVRALGCVISR